MIEQIQKAVVREAVEQAAWYTVFKIPALIAAVFAFTWTVIPDTVPYKNQAGYGEFTCLSNNGLIRSDTHKDKIFRQCTTHIQFTPYGE